MYANLFFYSENKVAFLLFSSDICSASGHENEAVYYSVMVPGRVRNTLQDSSCLRLKERAPEGRGRPTCPKTRKLGGGGRLPVEITSKHSLFLMTPAERQLQQNCGEQAGQILV